MKFATPKLAARPEAAKGFRRTHKSPGDTKPIRVGGLLGSQPGETSAEHPGWAHRSRSILLFCRTVDVATTSDTCINSGLWREAHHHHLTNVPLRVSGRVVQYAPKRLSIGGWYSSNWLLVKNKGKLCQHKRRAEFDASGGSMNETRRGLVADETLGNSEFRKS